MEVHKSANKNKIPKGFTLTISVLMVVILCLVALGLSELISRYSFIKYRNENSRLALYLAESGVSEAIMLLSQDWSLKDNPGAFQETQLGEGSYDVDILQSSNRVVLESVGVVREIERTILVEVAQSSDLSTFKLGIFANKKTELEGNSNVTGDVHSNTDVKLNGNATVVGSASAVDDVTISGNASASQTVENAQVVNFPMFDFNYYYNTADPSNRFIGDQDWASVNLAPANGIIYVKGDVKISGDSQLTGAIVATGKIEISGTFNHNPSSNMPALMSRDSDINLSGNTTIRNGLLYSGANDIKFQGTTTVSGVIIAHDDVMAKDSFTMTYVYLIPPGMISGGASSIIAIKKRTYIE